MLQGRHKAIEVQRAVSEMVCHSLDLNPVRADVTSVAELENDRLGSFHGVMNGKQRLVEGETRRGLSKVPGIQAERLASVGGMEGNRCLRNEDKHPSDQRPVGGSVGALYSHLRKQTGWHRPPTEALRGRP